MLFVALVCTATLLVYGAGATRLGFYSDDAGFLVSLPKLGFTQTLQAAADYVPGRNLHVVWQQLLFLVAGTSPDDLGKLHLMQAGLDALAVGCLYGVSRQLGLPSAWALAAAAIFAFYPNHGETHFWLSAAPMNLLSTIFVLAYASAAIRSIAHAGGIAVAAAEVCLFAAALFTYDQTFFVLVFILGVRMALLLRSRRFRSGLLLAGLCGVPVVLYAALKIQPSSGPTLTNVSLAHVLETFIASLSLTIGRTFQSSVQTAVDAASLADRLAAAAVAIGFVVTCCAGALRVPGQAAITCGPKRSGLRVYAALVALGIGVMLLAYGPTYLWFISPRHNFLPSAGLALALGAMGAFLTSAAGGLRRPALSAGLVVAVSGVIGLGLFAGVAANLSEKTAWITAYQLRSGLYADLAGPTAFANKTAIVFENFPSHLGRATFFDQENYLAPDYLYPRQAAFTTSGTSAISTPRGYFVDTEFERFGMAAFFVPRGRALHITYVDHAKGRIEFKTDGDGHRASDLYSVTLQPGVAIDLAQRGMIRAASVRQKSDGSLGVDMDLDVRSADVPADAELALVLSVRHDRNQTPLSTRNAWGEPMLIPVALGWGTELVPSATGTHVVVDMREPSGVVPNVVALFVFSETLPRLLQEVPLERRDT